jgi:hypothetical protein
VTSLKIKYAELGEEKAIQLPEEAEEAFDYIPKKLILSVGSWKREVDIDFNSELGRNTIVISKGIFPNFFVPEELDYEIKIAGRELRLGPVISYLLEAKREYITPERLEKLRVYYNNHGSLRGLMFISAVDQINLSDKTMEGFYFNGEAWREGVFPYPGAIYRKADIPETVYEDLINNIGDRIFNSYFFDKWETWEILSTYPHLRKHLPHTERLDGLETLDRMLELHKTVYLKQARGYKAKGIIRAEKQEGAYQFTYRLKGVKTIGEREEAAAFIKELNEVKKGRNFYLVQQAVTVKKYQNRPYDFRVVLQKDKSKQWSCTGIIARFGKRESIATNFLLSGYALPCYEALKRVFRMSEREVFLKQQEIVNICLEVCGALDKAIGNYGDLGIDVMVDENKKVWILEINKTHDHKFPLYSINDTRMYSSIITKPFEYARALAGFPDKG